jgi:hypothetical protein
LTSQLEEKPGGATRRPAAWRKGASLALVASLMLTAAPVALHAEASNAELAKEIAELKAQIREMRGAMASQKRVVEKVRVIASRRVAPAPAAAGGYPALPAGSVPAFVTASKQLQFGSLTITPGGFFEAASVFRSRTVQADINTPWNSIPFGPQAGTREFRFTSRASRVAALVEAQVTPTFLLSGYGELDFQGSGVNSNENQSNSFVPRIRNLYAAMDMTDYGVHVLAGQNWSLATMNSKGITPRNEVTPPGIDAGYVPGFVYKRQPQIRLTKDFGGKLWLSVSAEQPQTTYSGCVSGVNGTTLTAGTALNPVTGAPLTNSVTCQLPGVGILNGTTSTVGTATGGQSITNFSLNHVPDVIGKAAYEARVGERDIHLEGFGLYRDIYDRVAYSTPLAAYSPQATNRDATGYGVGGGVIAALLPRKLDFQASTLYGRGVGSYGTSQLPDSTFGPTGAGSPITTLALLGGLVAHVTPSIDLYAFGGEEVAQPKYYTTNNAGASFATVGYGTPNANNTGCFNTITATSGIAPGNSLCTGNTKRIWQLTGGMWDRLYKGSFGEVRVGVQYSYTERELFSGNGVYAGTGTGSGGTVSAVGTLYGPGHFASPKQNENIVMTSLRYYPFQ